MSISSANGARPPIHVLASESDIVAEFALRAENRHPVVAAMLLEEIERAELHEPATLPTGAVRLDSEITFVDERARQVRRVQLVLPVAADIAEHRISILTPIGAALYGLKAGDAINWPDIEGRERRIRITNVTQPSQVGRALHQDGRPSHQFERNRKAGTLSKGRHRMIGA